INQKRLIVMASHAGKDLQEMAKGLDKKEAERIAALFGAQSVLLSVEQGEGLTAHLRLGYAGPQQAQEARDAMQTLVTDALSLLKAKHAAMLKQPVAAALYDKLTAALNSVAVEVKDDSLQITAEIRGAEAALRPLFITERAIDDTPQKRAQAMNNLK